MPMFRSFSSFIFLFHLNSACRGKGPREKRRQFDLLVVFPVQNGNPARDKLSDSLRILSLNLQWMIGCSRRRFGRYSFQSFVNHSASRSGLLRLWVESVSRGCRLLGRLPLAVQSPINRWTTFVSLFPATVAASRTLGIDPGASIFGGDLRYPNSRLMGR